MDNREFLKLNVRKNNVKSTNATLHVLYFNIGKFQWYLKISNCVTKASCCINGYMLVELYGQNMLFYYMPRICANSISRRATRLIFAHIRWSVFAWHMLPSNCGVCFNWNAIVAAAETTFKLLLQMKTALYADLRYFFPLIEEWVRILVPSKAGNRPAARSLLNMHVAMILVLCMRSSCLCCRCC